MRISTLLILAAVLVAGAGACSEGSSPVEPEVAVPAAPAFARSAPPAVPAPTSPANGGVVEFQPYLKWGAVQGAQSYRLMVARRAEDLPTDPNAARCPACLFETQTLIGSSRLTSVPLVYGQTYYWQVQSISPSVARSAWSVRYRFVVGSVTFTWPVDAGNRSRGYFGSCADGWCYWISQGGWRDAQPFLYARNPTMGNKYHLGADYNHPGDRGMPVYAAADGIVSHVIPTATRDAWGRVIFIRHLTPGGWVTTMYAHVNPAPGGLPREGALVRRGQQIAVIGDANGYYRGMDHLHFEVRQGDGIVAGLGYSPTQCAPNCPQKQMDPNVFVRDRL
ncbi:MAG TPA: M23 family metallopeptidase [Longimicrobiaceae bacterium]|nr:M23 family metallopeptidase [Longimicrobiaceae bacterium]